MSETQQTPRKRRPRSPSAVKPAFIVVQVLNHEGQPEHFDKKRLRVVSVERDAEKVMALTEDRADENMFYIRIVVPPTAPQQARRKPELQTAA